MNSTSSSRTTQWRALVITLTISLAGGLVGFLAGLPAGLLMGGAIAVSIAGISGVKTYLPGRLRNTAFVVIGMTLGTNVASDSLSLMVQWPFSLLGLVLALLLIVSLCTLVLRYVFGFDKATAYLASFPGHLSFVLGMAEAGYGNIRQISIIQSMRVLLLTVLVPVFTRFNSSVDLSLGPQGPLMSLPVLGILAIACAIGGFVFHWLKIPAAFVLGSMIVATAGKLMGLYDGRLPFLLVAFGFVVMGGLIGSRFSGTTLREIRHAALGGVAITFVSVVVISAVVFGLTQIVDMPFGQLWLGMAPGALESMGALGIALGFDTAFIAAHHTARFFLLTMAIPSVGFFVGKRD